MLARSLIRELETAIRDGSQDDRVETLRRITDLFLASSSRLSDDQIDVFDNVIGHLLKQVENRRLAELSERLAPIENAPNGVIQNLARNYEIAVAGPVLAFSSRLTSADIVEIATCKGQFHLLAISSRTDLGPSVTDVLVNRGNADVHRKVASNLTARFSDEGMVQLVRHAEDDEVLSERLGLRLDIPVHVLRNLLEGASESVRQQILAGVPAAHRADIVGLLQSMGSRTDDGPEGALSQVKRLHEQGQLDEIALLQFARAQQSMPMIAALSHLCSVGYREMEQILRGKRTEDLLVPCRAAGVSWTTFKAMISANPEGINIGEQRLAELKKDYARLTVATAQRVLSLRCRQIAASGLSLSADPL